jgi:hypothetical protein
MRTRIGLLAVLATLGVSVALFAGGRPQQRGVNPEPKANVPPPIIPPDTFHDVPETVDNFPIRIYRIGHYAPASPTVETGSSGKRWLLTNSDKSLAVNSVWIWAGEGGYGSLPFIGQIPAQPGDAIQLDFTNAGMDHHTVTIRQDTPVDANGRAPLRLENDDFAFQEAGTFHYLKLDPMNDSKYTLNSVRVTTATTTAMLCVRNGSGGTAAYPCGFTNDRDWKVQIKICSVACVQASQPQ